MVTEVCRRWPACLSAGLALALSAALSWSVAADEYPQHAVKIIVPYPAGGSADVLPRVIGDWLSRKWGQPVVIENRAGAGGNVGAEAVALAPPDGYTLLGTAPAPLAINQNLYPRLAFDPAAFVPITVVARIANALLASRKIAATNVAELIAYARANPGKLTYGSQGIGTTSHLTAELFKAMAGIDMVHVPYRGSAPALNGLIAGDVDLAFDNLGVSRGFVSAGSIKMLAVASAQRLPGLAEVPTIAETLPGFVSDTWFAIAAPPKTPAVLAQRISRDIALALKQPEVIERLATLSAEPGGADPAATAAFIREETARWANVIKTAGIKME
ncbi:MAG TPA: tripartite tricarboxylate transporter substrate binding protein [Xanthobacteraceae bacterium]|nr:tripartite tricarboxylate transporter substrate binding protein [Xanthobacteraceae bacterium]